MDDGLLEYGPANNGLVGFELWYGVLAVWGLPQHTAPSTSRLAASWVGAMYSVPRGTYFIVETVGSGSMRARWGTAARHHGTHRLSIADWRRSNLW